MVPFLNNAGYVFMQLFFFILRDKVFSALYYKYNLDK